MIEKIETFETFRQRLNAAQTSTDEIVRSLFGARQENKRLAAELAKALADTSLIRAIDAEHKARAEKAEAELAEARRGDVVEVECWDIRDDEAFECPWFRRAHRGPTAWCDHPWRMTGEEYPGGCVDTKYCPLLQRGPTRVVRRED